MTRASFLARRSAHYRFFRGATPLICEIWGTPRVSLWLGRSIAEVGILFLTVESSWQLLLTLSLDLVPKSLFDFAALLDVAGLKQIAPFWIQQEAGIA